MIGPFGFVFWHTQTLQALNPPTHPPASSAASYSCRARNPAMAPSAVLAAASQRAGRCPAPVAACAGGGAATALGTGGVLPSSRRACGDWAALAAASRSSPATCSSRVQRGMCRGRSRPSRLRVAAWQPEPSTSESEEEDASYYRVLGVASTASTDEIKVRGGKGVSCRAHPLHYPPGRRVGHACWPGVLPTCSPPCTSVLMGGPAPCSPSACTTALGLPHFHHHPDLQPNTPLADAHERGKAGAVPSPSSLAPDAHTHPAPPAFHQHSTLSPPPQRAYRRLAKEFHPDVSADDSSTEFAMFLNEVYEVGRAGPCSQLGQARGRGSGKIHMPGAAGVGRSWCWDHGSVNRCWDWTAPLLGLG